jgi:hypothetical protein
MHKIEYEIKLNEYNRPYISLSEDYENNPEDKFFAIEMATYFIRQSFQNKSHVLDENTMKRLGESVDFLLDIADNMAQIVFDNMKSMGELDSFLFKKYHIKVSTLQERDSIGEFTAYNDRIYEKKDGLKVFVEEIEMIYVFRKNDENEYWEEICQEEINPPHLQRLNYNPDYYTPDESELKVGDDIVIGTYASDCHGSPSIRWMETTVAGLPLCDYYHPYVTCRKLIKK